MSLDLDEDDGYVPDEAAGQRDESSGGQILFPTRPATEHAAATTTTTGMSGDDLISFPDVGTPKTVSRGKKKHGNVGLKGAKLSLKMSSVLVAGTDATAVGDLTTAAAVTTFRNSAVTGRYFSRTPSASNVAGPAVVSNRYRCLFFFPGCPLLPF